MSKLKVLVVYDSHIRIIKHLTFADAIADYDYYTDIGYRARICSENEAKRLLDKDIQSAKKTQN